MKKNSELMAQHSRFCWGEARTTILCLLCITIAMVPAAIAEAQQPKVARIGFLGNSTPELEANLIEPFREGLRELGYVEGKNLAIEWRWAEGKYERFPALIAELIASKVDLIVTAGTPASLAVKKATTTIPLVMIAVGDPVGSGLIASLAHPGGNITGLTSISPELDGKRLELLREVVPNISHVAVMWNPTSPLQVIAEKATRAAAQSMGIKILSLGVKADEQFDHAFATLRKEKPGALLVLADRLFLHNRARIVAFAARRRLPAVYAYRELVDAGGLMSFGPNYAEMHRRAATYVDRIFKGAKAGDLPIEQPTKFHLLINLRAANAIGLAIPQALLVRADELIR